MAFALPLLGAAFLFSDPSQLYERLHHLMHGICAQRLGHSLVIDGEPVVLEARMFGIFAGFALSFVVGWPSGALRRVDLPRGWIAAMLGVFVLAMAVDGLNATAFDFGFSYLYLPRIELRLATGMLGGLALGAFSAPVVNFVLWRDRESTPFYARWRELAGGLAACGVVGALAASGLLAAVIVSIVAVLSVVMSFSLVNAYIWVLCWEGQAKAASWSELGWVWVAGFSMTVAELLGLAWFRGWAEPLGMAWPI